MKNDNIIHMTKKSKLFRLNALLIRTVIVAVFVIVAIAVVGYAQGIKFDRTRLAIEATGAIYLNGDIKDARILLDNKEIAKSFPAYIRDLKPDQVYKVTVEKDGYNTWSKIFHAKASIVQSAEKIVLYKNDYQSIAASAVDISKICNENVPSKNDQLTIMGGELKYNQNLVTRLSTNIAYACWMGDKNHIVYATKNLIKIIEKDGGNDTLIFTAAGNINSVASVQNDTELVYADVDLKWWRIEL